MFAVDGLDTIDNDAVRIGRLRCGKNIFDMGRMIQFHLFYPYFFIRINSLPSTHNLISLLFSREVLDAHIIIGQEVLEDLKYDSRLPNPWFSSEQINSSLFDALLQHSLQFFTGYCPKT
jgi:hypothetical protein